jgi:hypothetical protein
MKHRKNSYTGPLCITDPEYGGHNEELQGFGLFFARN